MQSQYTWINKAVYPLLERIGSFQVYFQDMAELLAAACFLMAIGMTCVKVFLQAASWREQFTKLFLTLVIYLVMLFFYPVITKAIVPFAQNVGYDLIFSSGDYTVDVPEEKQNRTKPSKQEFYKWFAKNSAGVFSTTTSTDENGDVKQALDINIVDRNSGLVDLNMTFKYAVAMIVCGWNSMPKINLFSFEEIVMGFFFIASVLVACVCYIVVLINYVMALLDYYFLVGFGLFFLPLSLWDGSKQYAQAIIGNFVKIMVKLMIISTVMFLSIMSMIDMYVALYMDSLAIGGIAIATKFSGKLQFCLTLIFQSILLFVMTKHTSQLASMLCGADPQMSFGEFARAAAQTAAVGAGARGIQQAGAKAALAVASGGASAVSSGALAAKGLTGAAKAGAFMKGAGQSIGKSLGNGLKNLPSSAGGALRSMGGHFNNMTGINIPGGSEGGALTPNAMREILADFKKGGGSFGGAGAGMAAAMGDDGPSGNVNTTSNGPATGNQAQAENASGLSTGGGNSDPLTNPGIKNTSGSGSESARVKGETYNNADWKQGNTGVYGNATNGGNSFGGKAQDALTRYANQKSMNADGIYSFRSGTRAAFAANMIRQFRETHAERMNGNRVGNGYGSALGRAIRNTMSQNLHGMANRGNTVYETPAGDKMTVGMLGAMSEFKDANGNAVSSQKNAEWAHVFDIDQNQRMENFESGGIDDSDAVNMAKDADKEARSNE